MDKKTTQAEELLTGHTGGAARMQKARAVLQTTFRPQVTPLGKRWWLGRAWPRREVFNPPTAPHSVLWGLQNLRQ